MKLADFTERLNKQPFFKELTKKLLRSSKYMGNFSLSEAVRPYIISALHNTIHVPILMITTNSESALKLFAEFQIWCRYPDLVYFYPDRDEFKIGQIFTDPEIVIRRLQVLDALSYAPINNSSVMPLVVCSISAAAQITVPKSVYKKAYRRLEVGMEIDPSKFVTECLSKGYDINDIVEIHGSISRRGGIIDVFSPNNTYPVRIEFFGNKIESLRYFEPQTQRSQGAIDSVSISMATESTDNSDCITILDYLPENAVVITDASIELETEIKNRINSFSNLRSEIDKEEVSFKEEQKTTLLAWEGINGKIEKIGHRLTFSIWDILEKENYINLRSYFSPVPRFNGVLPEFIDYLQDLLKERKQIVIVSQQTERLVELLDAEGISINKIDKSNLNSDSGQIFLAHDAISAGWSLKNEMVVFSDSEIFGISKRKRQIKRSAIRHHLYMSELKRGDYIVHIGHGVGKYLGLIKINNEKYEREYLLLEYASGDKLYVPVDQIDRVSRFIGSGDQQPRLSRLSTQEWTQTKERIRKSVREIAEDLLKLYAKRETVSGFAYSIDNLWQAELESSFPFRETDDQLAAIKAVKTDMEMPRPMDRLICGDVGYGKTEIALRAAFKAVMNNKQVVILVPTTILAQQHLATFKERLQAFPIRVAALSRFSSSNEQSTIIKELATGSIDICIGTHRLLQKDVNFKDLGLLIIDEEQRFGVFHKEYFKTMREAIDVLTLSATPIPRTLYMSLSGIKDLSVMETPPEERLPIKTHVGVYSDLVVRNAIIYEMMRNGQIYYVHNRIHDLMLVAEKLRNLVPDVRILVAHGQMPEEQLEKIMSDFYDHQADILLTTTIIESGLDIPNVNTLIVDNSDKFGLTQLYQLRGRIGRSNTSSFAYFLFNGDKQMTNQARERLRTIAEATELGAGYAIAMRDLEIRGTGNLLGSEQSGYIAAVGFDLYCRLLAEAVEDVKNEKIGQTTAKDENRLEREITIDLPIKAFIPEEYISNTNTRIEYYQKLAVLKDINTKDIIDELTDRFGVPAKPVVNLLYIVNIKKLAIKTAVESILTRGKDIVINCNSQNRPISLNLPKADMAVISKGNRQVKIDISNIGDRWQNILVAILKQMIDV